MSTPGELQGREITRVDPLRASGGLPRDSSALLLAASAALAAYSPPMGLRLGAIIAFCVFVANIRNFRPRLADFAMLGFTLWAALSITWTVDVPATRLAATNFGAVMALFLAARASLKTRRQLAIVALGYLIGCTYVLARIFTGNAGVALSLDVSTVRHGIEGVNANYSAYALATGLVAITLLWRMARRPYQRAALTSGVFALTVGVAQTGSRGAIIGCAVFALWVVIGRLTPRAGLKILATATVLAGAAITTGSLDRAVFGLDTLGDRATGDLSGRLTIWPVARSYLAEANPLTGYGASAFASLNPLGYFGTHSIALEILVGLGAIGLALAMLVWVNSLFPRERSINGAALGAYIAVTAPIALSGMWEQSAAGWLMLAIVSCSHVTVEPPDGEGVSDPYSHTNMHPAPATSAGAG